MIVLNIIVVIILALIFVDIALSVVLFNSLIVHHRKHEYFDEEYLRSRFTPSLYDEIIAWYKKTSMEEIHLKSFDGLDLFARFIEKKNAKRNVILVHGYTSISNRMLEYAKFYYDNLDANILLVDLRSHGKSEGKYISLCEHESSDLKKWVDYVSKKNDLDIVIQGSSMGAASTLMLADYDCNKLKLLIDDCGFKSAYSEINYVAKQKLKIVPGWIIYPFIWVLCKVIAHFDLRNADAYTHVKQAIHPIVFVHGKLDETVNPKDAVDMYEACPSDKELLMVENCGHTAAYLLDTKHYQEVVTRNINKYC